MEEGRVKTQNYVHTIEEALITQNQLIELTNSAGLPLSKWSANHPKLLENIPQDQREKQKVLSWGGGGEKWELQLLVCIG